METGRSDLVNQVVGEVMKRIRPPVLCLFTGGTGSLETVSQQMARMAGLPCRYRCAFSRAAGRILGKGFAAALNPGDCTVEGEGETSPLELVAGCRTVVVPVVCQNTAVKAALGIRDSLASEILACAFLMGKPVILVRDSVAVSGVPAAYGNMLSGHLKVLEIHGARVIAAESLSAEVEAALQGETVHGVEAQRPVSTPKNPPGSPPRSLIDWRAAEAWVRENGASEPFVIPAGTIVTPLAVDYFKEKRVRLVRGARGCPGGGGKC